MKKLTKSNKNKMIAGVCGGVAEYFSFDATIVRLIFGVVTLFWGAGILFYILAALIMPSSENEMDDDVENLKSANLTEEEEMSSESPKSKTQVPHTDEEFDAYFKK